MPWTIVGAPVEYARSGVDAAGWLWEIERDGTWRKILVEITGPARGAVSGLPRETLRAIETEGRSEVERVLELENPPRIIACGTAGCEDIFHEAP